MSSPTTPNVHVRDTVKILNKRESKFMLMTPNSTRVGLYSRIEFELLQKRTVRNVQFSFAVTKMKIHLRQVYTTTI